MSVLTVCDWCGELTNEGRLIPSGGCLCRVCFAEYEDEKLDKYDNDEP